MVGDTEELVCCLSLQSVLAVKFLLPVALPALDRILILIIYIYMYVYIFFLLESGIRLQEIDIEFSLVLSNPDLLL